MIDKEAKIECFIQFLKDNNVYDNFMIDKEAKIECFIQFLKDNNVYDNFMIECNKNKLGIKELLSTLDDIGYMNIIFPWYKTRDGFNFWDNIDDKWRLKKEDYYKRIRRNEIIEKILC